MAIQQVLAAADTEGRPFRGRGKDTVLLVDFGTGSTLTLEAERPQDNFGEYDIYVGLSANNAITAGELSGGNTDTVSNIWNRLTIPNGAGDQHVAFGVPSSKHLAALYDPSGRDRLGDFTLQATTVTISGVDYQVWYLTDAVDIDTLEGQVWTLEVRDDDVWVDVSTAVLGAANISADGQHVIDTSPDTMYRVTPAAAGSQAWIMDL